MPGTFCMMSDISSPFSSMVLKSFPNTFRASCPLVPVSVSPTLSSMGWEKFQIAPGNFAMARSMAAISSSLFSRNTGRHCALGLRSMKYSVFPNPPVSVPSSGRPISETTCLTSGNAAKITRAWFIKRVPSVRLVLWAKVPRAQIDPSSR